MLPELTPAGDRAVQAGLRRARGRGADTVSPDDLLFGLLQEAEGRPTVLLAGAGADLAAVRADLQVADLATADAGPLPFSGLCQMVFNRAAELAAAWTGEHTVGSDALLVALLRSDAALCVRLQGHGLNPERFEAQLPAVERPTITVDDPLVFAEPAERIDLGRILDAGGNRAREALRVIEDYCRFALDDAFLSRETKQVRHDLAEALADVPVQMLLAARETQRDVGTRISTAAEQDRHSLRAVVHANLKRLQEALRSLEEHGKLLNPRMAGALARLRYRAYTLERALVLGAAAREQLADIKVYVLLTGSSCRAALDWTIQEAAAGGARMFQLREKRLHDGALLERARKVRRWTREASALFILNDRPDIARLAEADGVHLGQEDLPVKEARRILGPDAIIGVSTHDLDQLRRAVRDGASYVGVGPTFASETKEFAELSGVDFVRQAMAETTLPAFVIGGVNLTTINEAVAAGARRVAVSQAICLADDPRAAAAALLGALTST
jgi:thiamine-phosphate pyrophosphorylase